MNTPATMNNPTAQLTAHLALNFLALAAISFQLTYGVPIPGFLFLRGPLRVPTVRTEVVPAGTWVDAQFEASLVHAPDWPLWISTSISKGPRTLLTFDGATAFEPASDIVSLDDLDGFEDVERFDSGEGSPVEMLLESHPLVEVDSRHLTALWEYKPGSATYSSVEGAMSVVDAYRTLTPAAQLK